MSQIDHSFTSLRLQSPTRPHEARSEPRVSNFLVHLSVRLLADADAESDILESLHGAEIRAEDDSQAKRVAGIALKDADRATKKAATVRRREQRTALCGPHRDT